VAALKFRVAETIVPETGNKLLFKGFRKFDRLKELP
jgi:hypothetical protein